MTRDSDRHSRRDRFAADLVQRLVDAGIDGVGPLDPARDVAERARAASRDAETAVGAVVASHTRLAAASGFVTGVGGFVTMPVSLPANVAGFYVVATRMVAAISHLRGYDLAQPEVRTAVLLALVGADADDLLAKARVASPGGRVSRFALRRLPASALMMVNKGIGFRLLTQLGRRGLTRLGRAVPFAGGVLGAGLDAFLLRRIAAAARTEFPPRA